jgi:hypothetical protein
LKLDAGCATKSVRVPGDGRGEAWRRSRQWSSPRATPVYAADFADFDEADLMDGDVTVRVTHSTVNYKDGLAVTGKAPVVRRFP